MDEQRIESALRELIAMAGSGDEIGAEAARQTVLRYYREQSAFRDRCEVLNHRLRATIEDYDASIRAFEMFRVAIATVQRMQAFAELPQVLGRVRRLFDIEDVIMHIAEEDFAEFAPSRVGLAPRLEMEEVLSRTCPDLYTPYLGPIAALPEPEAILGAAAANESLLQGSCFVYPMRDKYSPQTVVGPLALVDTDPGRYGPDMATDFLEHFCELFAGALVTLRDHEKVKRETVIDELTGVHNRTYLRRHAPRLFSFAERKSFGVHLVFIDLDGFKAINDDLGHDVGDKVLVEVGGMLRSIVRQYDILVRLGGDEFVVLFADMAEEGALSFAERVRDGLASIDVSRLAGQQCPHTVGASIGTAAHEATMDLDDLLHAADQRMYADKKTRRN